MTTTLCPACSAGPGGDSGHPGLDYYVEGPYPGHHIYKCALCDERWIRHYGSTAERFAWTRYCQQFPMTAKRPSMRKMEPKVSL